VGAFDSIEAEAACPQCGDIFYVHGVQTKFFEPDYYEQRWMRPGEKHPLERMRASLACVPGDTIAALVLVDLALRATDDTSDIDYAEQ
jgi:hypothetical protein